MENIVSFGGNEHREAQLALPWYATGQLADDERSAVEAHLAICAACREDLEHERAMAAEVAVLPFDAKADWPKLRQRLNALAQPRPMEQRAGATVRRWPTWPGKLGWFLAGQLVAASLILLLAVPRSPPAEYHTLGAQPSHMSGNVIVMFQPDTREADMRAALVSGGLRIVEGPTPSGAYILRVAPADRDGALKQLRTRPSILLAQPIDADSGP